MRAERPVKTPDPIPFNVQDWLKEPWRPVTRRELWEFINRMEVGRRIRNRWDRRLKRLGRRLWAWLARSPLEVEDPVYR